MTKKIERQIGKAGKQPPNHVNAAAGLVAAFGERLAGSRRLGEATRTALEKSATYFCNNPARMDYATYDADRLPLGNGVTVAGCQLLVKKRL